MKVGRPLRCQKLLAWLVGQVKCLGDVFVLHRKDHLTCYTHFFLRLLPSKKTSKNGVFLESHDQKKQKQKAKSGISDPDPTHETSPSLFSPSSTALSPGPSGLGEEVLQLSDLCSKKRRRKGIWRKDRFGKRKNRPKNHTVPGWVFLFDK